MSTDADQCPQFLESTQRLFDQRYARECERLSRGMMWLMLAQWVACVVLALTVSPLTWIGSAYSIHVHVIAAFFIGGTLSTLGIWHLWKRPAAPLTRHVIAAVPLLWTCLLIHMTGGRIETHFHAFASIAILSLYRDWRILITATAVVAVDHLVRGVWFPQSVFGTLMISPYRWIEHAWWVLFEVSFLIPGCIRLKREIWTLCQSQVETEAAKSNVERQVLERTSQLSATVEQLDATMASVTETKQFMQTIIESVSGLFYVLDEQGRYMMWNQPMQSLLGATSEQMGQASALDFIHADDRPYIAEKIHEVFTNGQAVAEARLLTSSGIRYVVLNGRRVINDGRLILVGSGQDISERRATELELSEFRETLDKTHDCVFIFDPDSLIFSYVNQGAIRQVGYSREELLNMRPIEISPEFDEATYRSLLKPLMIGQTDNRIFETVHRDRQGREIPVEVTLQFVRMDAEAGKFVAVVRDITRRRHEEAERAKLENERSMLHRRLLEYSRKAGMAEVASGVLHNVGNVLNSINIATNVLQKQVESSAVASLQRLVDLIETKKDQLPDFLRDDPRGQQIPVFLQKLTRTLEQEQQQAISECTEILEHVEHIKEVVNIQQSMARSKAIAMEVDPADLVRQANNAIRDSLDKHGIRFEQTIDSNVGSFLSDKQRILQILINLITNSKDALVEAKADNPTIHVQVRLHEDQVIFLVADNGLGIPASQIEQVFQFGFTTKEHGHGFGLHYSANCAVELGGTLKVHSQGLGCGATFELSIPRRPSPSPGNIAAVTSLTLPEQESGRTEWHGRH